MILSGAVAFWQAIFLFGTPGTSSHVRHHGHADCLGNFSGSPDTMSTEAQAPVPTRPTHRGSRRFHVA
jgi:hypothetical protein